MFENFVNEVNTKGNKQRDPVSVGELLNSPLFNPNIFHDKLQNMDKLADRELYELLKQTYQNLLADIFNTKDPHYISILNSPRFITIFTQVIASVPMDYSQRIYCNKMAYDYLMSHPDNQDNSYMRQLYFSLSKIVNRDIIPSLLGLGITEDLASYIALARYSSLKDIVNVKRVNCILVSASPNIMTEQMIVYIFEKLFDRITPLFEGVMFDVYSDEQLMNTNVNEIYGDISLAILDILNNMPSDIIRKVLINYIGDYQALFMKTGVRFPIRSISQEYFRILQVVDMLEVNEKIYCP